MAMLTIRVALGTPSWQGAVSGIGENREAASIRLTAFLERDESGSSAKAGSRRLNAVTKRLERD